MAVLQRLVEALLAVSVEVDVTADTYTLHCELITTLLVLMATQVFHHISSISSFQTNVDAFFFAVDRCTRLPNRFTITYF
jgi:hypothetical protein